MNIECDQGSSFRGHDVYEPSVIRTVSQADAEAQVGGILKTKTEVNDVSEA